MGSAKLQKLSRHQLEKHIRLTAKNSSKVFLTAHAKKRMSERKITVSVVYACLKSGRIMKEPEPNAAKGSLECHMEHYCAGKNCCVVVALCDEDPTLICVTVFHCD